MPKNTGVAFDYVGLVEILPDTDYQQYLYLPDRTASNEMTISKPEATTPQTRQILFLK